jgi:hypothetical protein
MTSRAQNARNRKGGLSRMLGPGHPDVAQADQELREIALAEHIRRVVDAAPPLSMEQRSRLALLLTGDSHSAPEEREPHPHPHPKTRTSDATQDGAS